MNLKLISVLTALCCTSVYASDPNAFLQEKSKSLFGIDAKDLSVSDISKDTLGQTHTRYTRKHLGLPVFGEEIIVHSDKNKVLSVTNNAHSRLTAKKLPVFLNKERALSFANASLKDISKPGLKIDAMLGWYKSQLVWKMHYYGGTTNWIIYLDAKTGKTILKFNNLKTFAPIGFNPIGVRGRRNPPDVPPENPNPIGLTPPPILGPATSQSILIYNYGIVPVTLSQVINSSSYLGWDIIKGDMYITNMDHTFEQVFDPISPGTLMFFNSWIGTGDITDRDSVSITAMYGMGLTWDYYLNVHGRRGLKDDGKNTYGRTHYGDNYANAYMSDEFGCNCMTFGDGKITDDYRSTGPFVSIDITAHEMTHGITMATANLQYSGQSGALNESFSDVFGNAVYFYAAEHGINVKPRYWVGEDVMTPNIPHDVALRYMDHPAQDAILYGNEPDKHSLDHIGPDPRVIDTIDVHFTSGIPNNVFYLLAEGGVNDTSNLPVEGIGRLKAEKIFYRALTVYLSQLSDFGDACGAEVKAARDLYPNDVTMADKIKSAWVAVGLPIEQCKIDNRRS